MKWRTTGSGRVLDGATGVNSGADRCGVGRDRLCCAAMGERVGTWRREPVGCASRGIDGTERMEGAAVARRAALAVAATPHDASSVDLTVHVMRGLGGPSERRQGRGETVWQSQWLVVEIARWIHGSSGLELRSGHIPSRSPRASGGAQTNRSTRPCRSDLPAKYLSCTRTVGSNVGAAGVDG